MTTEDSEIKKSRKGAPLITTIIGSSRDGDGNGHGYSSDPFTTSERIKDVLATMSTTQGQNHADTVKTVKDTEAQLDRANGDRHADGVKTLKDVEVGLERSNGSRHSDVVKTLKDVEVQLDRAAADRFAALMTDVKDSEGNLAKDIALSKEATKDAQYAGEVSASNTRGAIRESELRNEITEGRTRDLFNERFRDLTAESSESFCEVKEKISCTKYELASHMNSGFKDLILEHKYDQNLMRELNAKSDRIALENHYQNLLQFKDAALLAEKLACKQEMQAEKNAANASRELLANMCDVKERIHAEGEDTRKLISSIELDRLRERASKAEQQLACYFTRGVVPVCP